MNQTAGLGVDLILDNKKITLDEAVIASPSSHEMISSLAIGGKLITTQHDLQLDPPYSSLLFMRSASISFLFEHSWILSSVQQGKYLGIYSLIINYQIINHAHQPFLY
jgi:hypothetical protein